MTKRNTPVAARGICGMGPVETKAEPDAEKDRLRLLAAAQVEKLRVQNEAEEERDGTS